MKNQFPHHPVRQVAYFVPDVVAAARRHSAVFGSGPFHVAEHIPLTRSEHRGRAAPLDHTSAYGQWGDLMIEFVQQNNDGPSVFYDLFPTAKGGFHHIALIVDDLQAATQRFSIEGLPHGVVRRSGAGYWIFDDGLYSRLRTFCRTL